jgi:hypothetical protein
MLFKAKELDEIKKYDKLELYRTGSLSPQDRIVYGLIKSSENKVILYRLD